MTETPQAIVRAHGILPVFPPEPEAQVTCRCGLAFPTYDQYTSHVASETLALVIARIRDENVQAEVLGVMDIVGPKMGFLAIETAVGTTVTP